MIKINLLSEGKRPVAVRKKKAISVKVDDQNMASLMLLLGLIPGLLGTGFYWWMLKSDLQDKKDIKAEREREYERLKPIIAEVEEFKKKQELLEQKIAVIQGLRTNQRGPVQIMDYISRALPEMVWLDRLEVQAAVIRINGRATNENAIANFIDNLDKVEEFQEPVLRQYRATNDALYSFEISVGFQLKNDEEGAVDEASQASLLLFSLPSPDRLPSPDGLPSLEKAPESAAPTPDRIAAAYPGPHVAIESPMPVWSLPLAVTTFGPMTKGRS